MKLGKKEWQFHLIHYDRTCIIWKCKTLNFTCYTNNIQNKCTISESCISKLQDINTESDIHTAEAILDFIEL